ncbi:DNA topoisomerase IV subunit B [Parvularcula bermudensis HTCC2503]|uniref:DNA topoisomerase 4 subunit B n=1 Tax=Parvularcula bermudensis (strain ATCC BAA-594 / HTCC2503 / KCTC 12087) TaxID=314260 RepID=E0TDR0_PARBH|nr:DNA topoisomerase IV subunit B [Parvularcula bermudensis]ADM09976.1 DNA topoisomerase IV subunit B [Parvularcula bermudensis HTCC2503]
MSKAQKADLFDSGDYTAKDIEVLEGLEPVRKRPGMYIGGTDERALHHLFAEVLDNSMDEAVAGHASRIEVHLDAEGKLTVADNGRGIPIDKHPKFKTKSALEVIFTTLHSGGKFSNKAYATSGGLHGVGISVVNALSDDLVVEVARNRDLYRQTYAKGLPTSKLRKVGAAPSRRGTTVTFHPDPEIFGKGASFKPARLFRMARSKAYLFGGVEIRWSCDPSLLADDDPTPQKEVLHFAGGLKDYLTHVVGERPTVTGEVFAGKIEKEGGHGTVEWAIVWGRAGFQTPAGQMADGFTNSYCNTVPTPEGGTHEQGMRAALSRGLKAYAELAGQKKAANITAEDVLGTAGVLLSVFVSNPEFQGQTKDKLATAEAQKLTEAAIRPAFDHWLAGHKQQADQLLEWVIDRAEDRIRRRKEKEVQRASAMKKLRLPGKLADCTAKDRTGTELFLVEGDSAGGSAKQARRRETQAILPLRGKILNVASSTKDKITQNKEVTDIALAMGVGLGSRFELDDLRYDKIVIMTDADVDGAHIAALLITFFHISMPGLIQAGRLYMAQPPLYRLSQGGKTVYALDDADREAKIKAEFKSGSKVDVGRFKGLGEMNAKDLKETTMDPATRILARVRLTTDEIEDINNLVDRLMGRNAEPRFRFIQDNAQFVTDDLDL